MLCAIDNNLAHRGLDGIAQLAAALVGIIGESGAEIGNQDIAVGIYSELETHRIPHTALEINRIWRCAIKFDALKSLAHTIHLVEMETTHYLNHEGARLKGGNLVVDVGVVAEYAQVGEITHRRTGIAVLGIFLHQQRCCAGVTCRCTEKIEHGNTYT